MDIEFSIDKLMYKWRDMERKWKENILFEIMVSSYCIVFRGVHKCKTVTALNINHGLYFSNPGSYKPGLVHCSKTQTKPHQNRGSDQVYIDQVSAWFNGGLNHGLDHCSKIGPMGFRYAVHNDFKLLATSVRKWSRHLTVFPTDSFITHD